MIILTSGLCSGNGKPVKDQSNGLKKRCTGNCTGGFESHPLRSMSLLHKGLRGICRFVPLIIPLW